MEKSIIPLGHTVVKAFIYRGGMVTGGGLVTEIPKPSNG